MQPQIPFDKIIELKLFNDEQAPQEVLERQLRQPGITWLHVLQTELLIKYPEIHCVQELEEVQVKQLDNDEHELQVYPNK